VKVDVETQGAAEALDERDRAGLGRLAGEPLLLDEMRGDLNIRSPAGQYLFAGA
jgi:hypothetical protein